MADEPADVNVKVERPGAMTIWQAAGTLGIGSVLALLIVPRLMSSGEQSQTFIQTKFIDVLEKNSERSAESTAAIKASGESMERVADKVDELADRMAPLVGKLDKVANAVSEQVEQTKADAEPKP